MKTWTVVTALVLALTSATALFAQPRAYVEEMQKALKAQGHDPGPIDGVIGPQTQSALKGYQRQHGLEETGWPNDPTLSRLGEHATATSTTATASAGEPRESPSASPQMDGEGQRE